MIIDLDKQYPIDLHMCPICNTHDDPHQNPYFYHGQLRCLNCKLIIALDESFVEDIWIGWDLAKIGEEQDFVIYIKNARGGNTRRFMTLMYRYNTMNVINMRNNLIDIKKIMDNFDTYRLLG